MLRRRRARRGRRHNWAGSRTATPSLAQLLASIAASEATHAVALSALNPAGG